MIKDDTRMLLQVLHLRRRRRGSYAQTQHAAAHAQLRSVGSQIPIATPRRLPPGQLRDVIWEASQNCRWASNTKNLNPIP